MGIGRFVYTPILPFMVEALPLTNADAGLLASANFLGYLLGALAAARPALPGSQRRWFLTALALSAATTAAMAATETLALFAVLRLAGGVASAFVLVFASALVLDRLAAAGRPALSSLHFAGVGAGIAVSAVAVALTAGIGYGWRAQWVAAGALSFAALALAAWLVPASAPRPPAPAASGAGAEPGRRMAVLVVAYGLFGFGYVITATFISAIVRADEILQPAEPIVWLAVGLAAIPSVALWGWLGASIGYARAFALACVVEAVGVALSVVAGDIAAVLASAVLLGGTFMGITALGLIAARNRTSGEPRRVLAVMTAAFGTGQMIGPGFAGWLFDLTQSLRLPSLIAAGALALAAVLALALPTARRAPSARTV